MTLFRLISWNYARRHRLRTLLMITAIALGVGTFVGMHAAGAAILSAFRDTVDRIAGKSQLQIAAGEAGVPEDVLERVQSIPEVDAAAPVVEAVVQTGIRGEGNLLVLGVDLIGDQRIREYSLDSAGPEVVDDPLTFLAQPDSLIISHEFAKRNDLVVNRTIKMSTMDGEKTFTIRGILGSDELTSAFGGNLAIMDIYAAQKTFGRGPRFDRIEIRLSEGTTLEQGQSAIQRALGPGFQIGTPATRGRQFESLMRAYSVTVDVTSLFAIIIGLFIIYNAFAMAVTQRRAEIGVLRTVGATRGQIVSLFMGESIFEGLIGALLGIAVGVLIAQAIANPVSNVMQSLFGMTERARAITLSPRLILSAMTMGIGVSVIAAVLPARQASSLDPVKALQKGTHHFIPPGENRVRRIAGFVLAVVAIVCLGWKHIPVAFYAGYISFLMAALLVAPTVSLWLTRALRPALKRIRPVEGTLAADNLLHTPRRTSSTVVALMLSTGLIISLGGISRSAYTSVVEWIDGALNSDLFVSASENLAQRSFHFPDEMTSTLASTEGIEEIQRTRNNRVTVNGESVLLVALDIRSFTARNRGRGFSAGDFGQMSEKVAQGQGLIASENFALLHKAWINDNVSIPSPAGMLRLPIVGILRDYTNPSGTLFVDYSVYLQNWNDPTVDIYRVYLKPGVQAEEVKRRILERFSQQRRLFVQLNRNVKERVLKNTDQWFVLTYIQIAIAVLVAVLGVANTLSMSITDRRREFGTLRAIGAFQSQVRQSVWCEALVIGVIGMIMGTAFGAIDLAYELHLVRQDYAGLTLPYQPPFGVILALGPVILLAAFVSSLIASEVAACRSLVEALEYE